jgi:hypothetical protein
MVSPIFHCIKTVFTLKSKIKKKTKQKTNKKTKQKQKRISHCQKQKWIDLSKIVEPLISNISIVVL